MAAISALGVDSKDLVSVARVRVGTVFFASAQNAGDARICVKVGEAVRYGTISNLLVDAGNSSCLATVSLYQCSGATLANKLAGAPQKLAGCCTGGLYGRDFVVCRDLRREIVAVYVKNILSHCLFVSTPGSDVYAIRLSRHFVHD